MPIKSFILTKENFETMFNITHVVVKKRFMSEAIGGSWSLPISSDDRLGQIETSDTYDTNFCIIDRKLCCSKENV